MSKLSDYRKLLGKGVTSSNREQIVEHVYKMARQVNQRFYRMEKAGKGLNDTAYRKAVMETGKAKPRYTVNKDTIREMTKDPQSLTSMVLQLNKKLESDTSTLRGLDKVAKKRVTGSYGAVIGDSSDISEEDYKKFLQDGGGKLLNQFDSDTDKMIIGMWEDYNKQGVSTKQFLREFKRYKDVTKFDEGKVRKAYKKIIDRKMRR